MTFNESQTPPWGDQLAGSRLIRSLWQLFDQISGPEEPYKLSNANETNA